MPFRISALPAESFQELFGLSDEELAGRGALRRVVSAKPGTPCRISLADAEPGEVVVLVNHEHLPGDGPYRASHAVFVRQGVSEAKPAVGDVPESLRFRLLSARAYDPRGLMLDAEVAEGRVIEAVIERMFRDPEVAFIHLHNAKPGCYAARVDRA